MHFEHCCVYRYRNTTNQTQHRDGFFLAAFFTTCDPHNVKFFLHFCATVFYTNGTANEIFPQLKFDK